MRLKLDENLPTILVEDLAAPPDWPGSTAALGARVKPPA